MIRNVSNNEPVMNSPPVNECWSWLGVSHRYKGPEGQLAGEDEKN